ncbi:hypothetical protein DFJ74DRAFT_211223 [Hyaloraphidium curvatum]|nr:hypothetical protein DFJ74DRAFT_211223 [Hyaloraphidium curvatum]
MALPRQLRQGFSPAEIEFIAGSEMVTVVPNEKISKLDCISGQYGPFRPPIRTKVPVWLAITLKRRNKCRIEPPAWLDYEHLKGKLAKEEESQELFSDLPFHYYEISRMLLECASDDIQNVDKIRTVLKDLQERRHSKARQGLANLDGNVLQMDNLGLMEINEIRPFFSEAFNNVRRMNDIADQDE